MDPNGKLNKIDALAGAAARMIVSSLTPVQQLELLDQLEVAWAGRFDPGLVKNLRNAIERAIRLDAAIATATRDGTTRQ